MIQPTFEAENARLRKQLEDARDCLEALKLHLKYDLMKTDRGGSHGPKGRALADFIAARDAAIAKAEGRDNG